MTAVPLALPEINVRPEDNTYPSLPPALAPVLAPAPASNISSLGTSPQAADFLAINWTKLAEHSSWFVAFKNIKSTKSDNCFFPYVSTSDLHLFIVSIISCIDSRIFLQDFGVKTIFWIYVNQI